MKIHVVICGAVFWYYMSMFGVHSFSFSCSMVKITDLPDLKYKLTVTNSFMGVNEILIFNFPEYCLLSILSEMIPSAMCGKLQVLVTLESTPDSAFRTDAVKYALIGLMRDLRGIAMATNRLSFSFIQAVHIPPICKIPFRSISSCRTHNFLASVAEHMGSCLIGCTHLTCHCS